MRFSKLLFALAILMFVVLGCVSTEIVEEDKTPGKETKRDLPKVYRFGMDTDAPTLDPAMVTDTVSDKVVRDIFDCLVKFDNEMNYIPVIAESWDPPPAGGTDWVFHIRKGVKFHNGREITARDVEYSFTRVLDPETTSPRTWVLDVIKGASDFINRNTEKVEGIEVIDEYTIQLTLEKPFAPFLGCLCMSTCSIVPEEETNKLDENGEPVEFSLHPVGSGAFKFKEWVQNSKIELVANEDYFAGPPKLEGVTYKILGEEMGRLLEFENGNIEHTDIPPAELDRILADPELSKLVVRRSLLDIYMMGFNCEKPPFKDNINLRKAFNYAVDKEHIVENVLKNNMEAATGYIPPGMPNYESPVNGYPYDPEKAQQYLELAGYPNGQGLEEITLMISEKEMHKNIAVAVQNDLKKIGVNVNIQVLDWGAFLDAVDNGEATFHQVTWLADYPDPDNFLWVLLHSRNWGKPGNQTRFKNEEFDKLVDRAREETDWPTRHGLYQEAEVIAFDECPWLLLFNNRCNLLVQDYVKDLEITALDRSPIIPNVELEKVYFK